MSTIFKYRDVPIPIFAKPTDPSSDTLSPDAVQIAELLSITGKVKRVQELLAKTKSEAHPDLELRQELTEAKLDVIEVIEQTPSHVAH